MNINGSVHTGVTTSIAQSIHRLDPPAPGMNDTARKTIWTTVINSVSTIEARLPSMRRF